MQVSVHKEGWIDEEGIYLFACLFSFRSRALEHVSMQIWLSLSFQNHHIYKSQWSTLCVLLFAWSRTSNCDKKKLFRENIRL